MTAGSLRFRRRRHDPRHCPTLAREWCGMSEPRETYMTGAQPDEIAHLIKSFHYSRRMPGNIQHCYAVRSSGGLFGDNGDPLACAIYSIPPTRWGEDLIELTRLVRRPDFSIPLTRLLSFSTQWLKKQGWALAVSFADRTQGHHGGIYQAGGWNYGGCRDRRMDGILVDGVFKPGRSCNSMWGTQSPQKLKPKPNAVRPVDELIPISASAAQPRGTAPVEQVSA